MPHTALLRIALVAVVAMAALACGSSSSEEAKRDFEEGSTFPELSLVGYLDKNADGQLAADEHGPLTPSAIARAYPNADLLLVHVAFEWCKFCWEETPEQIAWAKHYQGRFISIQVMVETRDGEPGQRKLLDSWIAAHHSSLPTVLEPKGTLFAKFGRNATYLLLDPRNNLRVLAVGAGPPQFEVVRSKIAERLGPLPPKTDTH